LTLLGAGAKAAFLLRRSTAINVMDAVFAGRPAMQGPFRSYRDEKIGVVS